MNSPLLLELLLLRDESLLEEEWDEDDDEEDDGEEEEEELTDEDLLRLRFRFFASRPVNQPNTKTKTRQKRFSQYLSNSIWSCYSWLHFNTEIDLLFGLVNLLWNCSTQTDGCCDLLMPWSWLLHLVLRSRVMNKLFGSSIVALTSFWFPCLVLVLSMVWVSFFILMIPITLQ